MASLRRQRQRAAERALLRQREAAILLQLAKLDLESAEEEEDEFFDARETCQSASTVSPIPPLYPNSRHDSCGRPWRRGDRVRITIAGAHQYRTARLDEPRKDWFWWMFLDPLPGEKTTIRIYKKVTSFQRWSK